MRIAICFFGLHPSECWVSKAPLKDLSHIYWKKNVFDQNDNVDIFLHSWSVNHKDKLIKEYNPTAYKIEHQKDFSNKQHLKSKTQEHILNKGYNLSWGEIVYSCTYGMKQVIELKKQYEKENNITYDYVMLARMDLIWLVPLEFKTLDTTKFYTSIWGPNNKYVIESNYKSTLGNWWISNSSHMNMMGLLYDHLCTYLNNTVVSYHTFVKTHMDSFLSFDEIEYKYGSWDSNNPECDKQRFIYKFIK